jgi:threonine synthase
MKHLGLSSKVPKISVVQAEGANPLYLSLLHYDGREIEPVQANTRATAIRIGNPASWRKAARIIQQTGGYCEQVSEAEIALAKAEIGQEGIGCEPASAVTLAGLRKFVHQGKIRRDESVVLLLTGHTLKDSAFTIDFHQGTLLRDEEMAGLEQQISAKRRSTLPLEASSDAVLRILEAAIQA